VQDLRRSVSFALLALLLVLVAGPAAAARCRMSGYCPMMARAAASSACHGAKGAGGMSAPMDCCRPTAAPAPTSSIAGLQAITAAVLGTQPAEDAGRGDSAKAFFSRAGQLHPLGLFTLHSVWRI
jgi:hypothetical protein